MSRACVALVALLGLGCTLSRNLVPPHEPAALDRSAPYLKAHLRDGGLVLLERWSADELAGTVSGTGTRYDEDRLPTAKGAMVVAIKDVALFETNEVVAHAPSVAALTIVSVLSAAVTVACIANPKACFGSCPTFYVGDGSTDTLLAAEGFSASVTPALEARDIDSLFRARPATRSLRVRVTNEALETHVIKRADLLVARRPPGGRVVATTDGRFYAARELAPPVRCRAEEGDCLAAAVAADDRERASLADARDLATRETIELDFAAWPLPPGGRRVLLIEARQTFITTYLFYQALAFMGRHAGTYLSALERGDAALRGRAARLHHLLGDIEVQIPDGRGGWVSAGVFDETGPLARDVQAVPLPPGASGERVRLRLTRGHWRLGMVALASLGEAVEPVRLSPAALVTKAGDGAAAAAWLAGRQPALVTGPGDEHELRYELPDAPEHLELFLDSRGYYLEWMREPWLAEESPWRLRDLLERPERALKELAPAFKRVEPTIEDMFWRSRYVRPSAVAH